MLILYSKLMRRVAELVVFNTIYWWFLIVAYFFCGHPVLSSERYTIMMTTMTIDSQSPEAFLPEGPVWYVAQVRQQVSLADGW